MITDLEITYGTSLAPAGFRKISLQDGGQAELNRGLAEVPIFLWYTHNDSKLPISEVKLLLDDEVCPEGFEKISRNVLKGSGTAYFCIRRQSVPDELVVSNLAILYSDEHIGKWYMSIVC